MSILEFIRDRARYYTCPACGRNLDGCGVRMLQALDDRFTVQVTCGCCGVQFVVILAVESQATVEDGQEPMEEVPTPAVTARSQPEPIKADEVLDVHILLRDFTGPITDLFRQPSADRR
jgi:hypothetical protein